MYQLVSRGRNMISWKKWFTAQPIVLSLYSSEYCLKRLILMIEFCREQCDAILITALNCRAESMKQRYSIY